MLSQETYRIITNPPELRRFIEWLPTLRPDETFYCCLFARSKYIQGMGITHIKSDKAQLKRFTSNKERLYDKIWQLECPMGSYKQKENVVPQEALALYITINPRSFIKANTASVRKLLDLALQPYNGFHPYQEVMSEIQKAKNRSEFVTFDFDVEKSTKHQLVITSHILNYVNPEAVVICETRGGYHVIISTGKILPSYERTWYNKVKGILNSFSSDHDSAGDIMLPIPGTYQGGFTPKFIYNGTNS